ncbi:hypothetical protein E4U13_008409, partial [Claviceps humidiphila]
LLADDFPVLVLGQAYRETFDDHAEDPAVDCGVASLLLRFSQSHLMLGLLCQCTG